ncbi:MAG: methylenetetrahydrofolate--tRNA-(uracil(54)-C(5))-methyltransferase (FADH(2)-oxidizing) TrmFO [Thermodesulfovibrionales bacterium]|nr:methylenetetrahydrofolate--tRNA-(uracil(54)-C(5))-methyltransferase (FADH(2)-oxidizing) TrmFO [Thermodesulfovibrionales bacterium]
MITIVGAGLAGSEAAWQIAKRGIPVKLYEMRPEKFTEAHRTGLFAELVCSNSLKSMEETSPSWILKQELLMAGSIIMESALINRIPAGKALAVDREGFSMYITEKLTNMKNIEIIRKEIRFIPDGLTIIATGPLTSEALSEELKEIIGKEDLYFYDAIAPVIDADSIDYSKAFFQSRYQSDISNGDYLNCPLNEEEYRRFYEALIEADRLTPRPFEKLKVFESCMPVETIAERGYDTLRFGPMKPVGLIDPRTGRRPFAVVQLRPENKEKTAYNMVGFQTRLRYPEQERVFRLIPGLERAVFLRYGSIHRNTYLNAPRVLNNDLSLKNKKETFIAGQLTGVEGYLESTAMGLAAAFNVIRKLRDKEPLIPPPTTAHGSLLRYLRESNPVNFQPTNINLSLFPLSDIKIKDRLLRKKFIAERALKDWEEYLRRVDE